MHPAPVGYSQQDRGGADAYASYFAGMDKSMRQKVALVSAYFPTRGRVADMGSGSGTGSRDLAALYPGLEVIGVDVNPTSVALAAEAHRLPNLRFLVGDIADKLLPDESLDGILDSSVLHHVTSFNGFSRERVHALLRNQVAQLGPGGVLAIRDFLAPPGTRAPGERPVDLQLPEADGTASLFERFCAGFRCLHHPSGGVPFAERRSPERGWRRFRVDLRMATEFLLRKDYREDWDVELLEEYLYFDQAEFESALEAVGMRLLLSRPLWNPWIVQNRFQGRYRWTTPAGEPLPHPATNYLVVAEKPRRGRALRFRERESARVQAPSFLRLESFRHVATGGTWDLASRPHPSVDVFGWTEQRGSLLVAVRAAYPRPLLASAASEVALDEGRAAGFLHEPLTVADVAEGEIPALALAQLGLNGAPSLRVERGLEWLPSPGGLGEKIRALWVELPEGVAGAFPRDVVRAGGLPDGGQLKLVEATQTLRAAQVGGMLDARVELNLHDRLLSLGRGQGPWIGAELPETAPAPWAVAPAASSVAALLEAPAASEAFERAAAPAGFLALRRARYEAIDGEGRIVGAEVLEAVVPAARSTRTASVIPYVRRGGEVRVGLERRELPAAWLFEQDAALWAVPAWRLPEPGWAVDRAEAWLRARAESDFGVAGDGLYPLGGAYCPSAGLTPETVTPYALPVTRVLAPGQLTWVSLDALLHHRARLRDGHLLVSAFRLFQATRGVP
jgi:SAM-dependent methyltransferase